MGRSMRKRKFNRMGIAGLLGLTGALLGIAAIPSALAQSPDDLLLQTRIDAKSTSWLIDKTRLILSNVKIDDKLTGEVDIANQPQFLLTEISQDPNYVRIRDLMGSIFKVDAKNAVIRLRIPKLAYQVQSIHAEPLSMNVQDPTIDLKVNALLQGISVQLTQGVQADFMIPNPKTHELESYFTAYVDPISLTVPKSLPPVRFEIDFETRRESAFYYTLKGYNLDAIPGYVAQNQAAMTILAGTAPNQGPLTVDHIRVNPVTVRLNQLSRSVEFDEFKPILQRQMPNLITQVMNLVGTALKNSMGPQILQSVFSSGTRSDVVVSNSHLYSRYSTVSFSQPVTNQLSLGVQGDLCTAETYDRYHEQCVQHEPKAEPVRDIPANVKQAARDELTQTLARGDADVGLSVSEEYINRLLKTTIDADLWDDMLADDHLAIGPMGAFTVFDQKTQHPVLYLDLYYLGDKGIQKVFVNSRNPIRFALRLSTSLSFVLKDEVPYLVIKIDKLLSDMNEIIYGIPEYNLRPKLVPLLKKKIARMVIDMATKLEGTTALEMDLPVFTGLGLEKTRCEISENGRLNIYFKI